MEALACCCAVTYVNGNLIGDPLDVKMFLSTKWVLDEDLSTQSSEQEKSFSVNDEVSEDNPVIANLYPEEIG